MSDKPTPPVIRSDAELAAWSRVLAHALGAFLGRADYAGFDDDAFFAAVGLADSAIHLTRERLAEEDLAGLADAHERSDPLPNWPLCGVCGLGPRETAHRYAGTWGHEYKPHGATAFDPGGPLAGWAGYPTCDAEGCDRVATKRDPGLIAYPLCEDHAPPGAPDLAWASEVRAAGQHASPTDRNGRYLLPGSLVACGDRMGRQVGDWRWDERPEGSEFPSAFFALFRDATGLVSAWVYRGASAWEILERGQPSDPVPSTYEPPVDAEGKPLLRP